MGEPNEELAYEDVASDRNINPAVDPESARRDGNLYRMFVIQRLDMQNELLGKLALAFASLAKELRTQNSASA